MSMILQFLLALTFLTKLYINFAIFVIDNTPIKLYINLNTN